jgi:membrane-bound serine protease (ClpP class)
MFKKYILSFLLVFFLATFSIYAQESNRILVLKLEGAINVASAEMVEQAVKKTEATSDLTVMKEKIKPKGKTIEANYPILIIQLNTEGGLGSSMRKIVESIRTARIPVVVYVAPKGARAASAGVFITLAADINAMAPSTNIGAAHPVDMAGKMSEEMGKKATNDAASFIRSIAEETGHNANWAEQAVRESVSLTATEAKNNNVVDILAEDLDDLIEKLDGELIRKGDKEIVLRTKDAIIDEIPVGLKTKFLHVLGNPNIAYLLLMIGVWGLILEFSHPGSLVGGTVGSICLLLGLYALSTLPINYAGLALIVLGVILLFLETQTATNGILTVGGVISLGLGSFMLIGSEARYISISPFLILVVLGITVGFFLFIVSFALKAQFRKVTTGKEGLINEVGYAKTDVSDKGIVYVVGEYWNAKTTDGKRIKKGEDIVVIKKEGKILIVKKKEETLKKEA